MTRHEDATNSTVAVHTYDSAVVCARERVEMPGEVGANRPLFASPVAADLRGLLLGLTQPSSA
jgi:hypothetical protein